MRDNTLEKLGDALAPLGLIFRGGFHAEPDDCVLAISDGRTVKTVVLIGNAGNAMWDAFCATQPAPGDRNPLDQWLRSEILAAAPGDAQVIFPNQGPPFPPIQDWAARAEPVYRSPMGIMIHPEFGLWHVYRAALFFDRHLDLPPRDDRPSPCESCADKPCLKVCPADAFKPDRFAATDCANHVASVDGVNCRQRGCLARRACPVGRHYTYAQPAQEFHTAAFLRAVKAGYGA